MRTACNLWPGAIAGYGVAAPELPLRRFDWSFPSALVLDANPAPEFSTRRRATEDEGSRPPPCDPSHAARGPALLRLRCERSVGRLPRARLRFRLRLRLRTYDPVKIGLDI